jgi:hypothetical protein
MTSAKTKWRATFIKVADPRQGTHPFITTGIWPAPSAKIGSGRSGFSPVMAARGVGVHSSLVVETVPSKMAIGDLGEDLPSGGTHERSAGFLRNLSFLGRAVQTLP